MNKTALSCNCVGNSSYSSRFDMLHYILLSLLVSQLCLKLFPGDAIQFKKTIEETSYMLLSEL